MSKALEFLKQELNRLQLGLDRVDSIDTQLKQQAEENEKQRQVLTDRLQQVEEALKEIETPDG